MSATLWMFLIGLGFFGLGICSVFYEAWRSRKRNEPFSPAPLVFAGLGWFCVGIAIGFR